MEFLTLDITVRRTLLEKGLPIHFYPEVLFHQSACLRELSKDSLQIIEFATLPVNTYGAIDLPADFVDDLAVAIPVGSRLTNIPKNNTLTPIRVHNTTTGAFEPPVADTSRTANANNTFFGFPGAWSWYWNVNDYGEPTGRFFGSPGGTSQGYMVVRDRRQIQLTENFVGTSVVLSYISNGQSVSNAAQVDWLAHSVIQAFSDWKMSPNASNNYSAEGMRYYNEKRLYRASKNDLTLTDFKNIMHNAYMAAPKT